MKRTFIHCQHFFLLDIEILYRYVCVSLSLIMSNMFCSLLNVSYEMILDTKMDVYFLNCILQYMLILFLLFLIQFSIACACLAVNTKQQEQLAEQVNIFV